MKVIIYRTAEPADWFVWNRYGARTIGAAFRVGSHYLLSVVWRKP